MVGFLIILAACTASGDMPDAQFMRSVVQSESGFAGAATVVDSAAKDKVCYITVDVPYRDVQGKEKMGRGRLMARRKDLESGKLLPPYCNVHYELDPGAAQYLCKDGWVVMTPHYGDPDKKTGYKLELAPGDSYNLSNALIQWVRRLPFIDRSRLFIAGGSAGGYMALVMGAQNFPVDAILADFPVVNWAYNINYFEANIGVTKYRELKDAKDSPMPVLCAVSMLTDWAYGVFGKDLTSDAYYYDNPISCLDRITCPVLLTTATGDLLVPIEQTARSHACPLEPGKCPEGYMRDIAKLAPTEKTRMSLEEVLPKDVYEIFVLPLPKGLHEYDHGDLGAQAKLSQKAKRVERPWSKERQWNIVILDEGPPIATSAHSRYAWNIAATGYLKAHRNSRATPQVLTPAKLAWLMHRYEGILPETVPLADGSPANRLNFDVLEKRDVVAGLLDYARIRPEHEARLKSLYAAGGVQPFGKELDLGKLESLLGGG
ncbi:MAG: prolyl oligopeptidase family serine peptidase [Candidatus Hydrogenedentes bacterium]|nr:prolyl oligopeptidase family serine peptidase [Candidatus Hydrogenedentota bacterium]